MDSRAVRTASYRILLVDDHGLFREGLTKIIEQEKDFVVCAAAANATEALRQVAETKPHIVLMDISLNGISGLEVSRQLRLQYPELRILFLSMHKELVYGERALQAGGNGYVMKNASGEKLLEAIRVVLSGRKFAQEWVRSERE
jgi:two-component system invasion response regulator UvrY